MKKNMGTIDRGIRVVIAITVGVLYFTGQISGTAGEVEFEHEGLVTLSRGAVHVSAREALNERRKKSGSV